jgi:NAD(P)H-dependent flavin oxidoreductase YrpB (nitropropane dioxygenase family)
MLSGMNWLTTPNCAAVSNAGGLGVLAGSQSGKERSKRSSTDRDLTDKPFGIN